MSNSAGKSVYDESIAYVCYKSIFVPSLRRAMTRCVASIFYNFFFRQYRAALLPGRVPVSRVDHPLDEKIPFKPSWVTIYLDFVSFWGRMLSFLLHNYGRKSFGAVIEFFSSIGNLYAYAAEVYRLNFSTTDRPFYIARPRFFLIHLVDPHLMCIPSLHVMVVVHTWKKFAVILRSMGDAERYAPQLEEMKQGALAITQAVLYVKQHSVNCVAAALYALTCFDAKLFPPEDAAAFTALLFGPPPPPPVHRPVNYRLRPAFAPCTVLPPEDAAEIKSHILGLYHRFLAEKTNTGGWEAPLLTFLNNGCPQKGDTTS